MPKIAKIQFIEITVAPVPENQVVLLATKQGVISGFVNEGEYFDLNGPFGSLLIPEEDVDMYAKLPTLEELT